MIIDAISYTAGHTVDQLFYPISYTYFEHQD